MGGQVVEDHDGPRFQLGDQNLFDIRVESIPIHGPGYDPGSHDPIAGQASYQSLISPSAEWSISLEAFAAQAPPILAGHFRVGARFLQEDQSVWLVLHGLLATAPVMPCFSNRGLAALPGDQAFFYMCSHDDAEAHQCHWWNMSHHGQTATLPGVQQA